MKLTKDFDASTSNETKNKLQAHEYIINTMMITSHIVFPLLSQSITILYFHGIAGSSFLASYGTTSVVVSPSVFGVGLTTFLWWCLGLGIAFSM